MLHQPIYQIASLLLSGVNKYVYMLFESCGFDIVGNIAAWLQRNFKESLISYMLIFPSLSAMLIVWIVITHVQLCLQDFEENI